MLIYADIPKKHLPEIVLPGQILQTLVMPGKQMWLNLPEIPELKMDRGKAIKKLAVN
jgi:hypothetical protein